MDTQLIEPMAQFGVAGLMGLLWVWERRLSRRREDQLDEAHADLRRSREAQAVLVDLVRQNTRAIERFDQTLAGVEKVLEQLSHELQKYPRVAG